MKKVFLSILAVLLVSCNQITEKSIEDRAIEQMKKSVKETLTNPEGAKLLGVRTEYQSDSLCVLEFSLNAKDGEGAKTTLPMEYIYIDRDKMSQGEHGQLEGCYKIGLIGNLFYVLNMIMDQDMLKEYKDEGFDPSFVLSNTVFSIKDKYRDELIKYANLSPTHPKIEDNLIFAASLLKIKLEGREVNNESKNIDL